MSKIPQNGRPRRPQQTAPVLSIDEILAAKRPRRETAAVTLDESGRTATFVFEALPSSEWEALVDAHQATDGQQDRFKEDQARQGVTGTRAGRLGWNPDTFPVAALAACARQPTMTVDQARALWDDPNWNAAEKDRLFSACVIANQSPGAVNLGKDLEAIIASASS